MRVLVTAAGATNGTALVKSLLQRGHEVVAADPSPYAPGRLLCRNGGVTSPWATEPEKLLAFHTTMATQVDAAMLQTTAEMPYARQAGLPFWGCSDEAIDVCEDKLAFSTALAELGIPHTLTMDTAPASEGPWIIKPRWGEGSRRTGVFRNLATCEAVFAEWSEDEPMITQAVLTGQEWEVDVFAEEGYLLGGVAFIKHRMKGGTTVAAETIPLDSVREIVEATVAGLTLNGPLNIGGFITDSGPVMLEVNPRFSHGYLIGEASGANPIEFWTRWMQGRYLDLDLLDSRPGVRFERYWTHAVAPI